MNPHPTLSTQLNSTQTLFRQYGAGLVYDDKGIRWLTPVEVERLQGFPENYTKVPYRNKPLNECTDTLRIKVIGNSMPVPVMKLIGEKILSELSKKS